MKMGPVVVTVVVSRASARHREVEASPKAKAIGARAHIAIEQ